VGPAKEEKQSSQPNPLAPQEDQLEEKTIVSRNEQESRTVCSQGGAETFGLDWKNNKRGSVIQLLGDQGEEVSYAEVQEFFNHAKGRTGP